MAKVVLIRPMSNVGTIAKMPRMPLALLYIGSVLKYDGHDVVLIDMNAEADCKKRIAKECGDATIVGVSALTSEVRSGLDITRFVKSQTKAPVVWGGIHASLFPEMTCQNEFVDYVVYGEGEYAMLELVDALEGGNDFEGTKGLVYHKNYAVVKNEPRSYIDLNDMPEIDYSLIDMDRYFEGGTWRKVADVQTSRGCPYKCHFCINAALHNHKVRFMSTDRVVAECERLVKDYGVNYITFIDDNFFINKKRAGDICKGLEKLKVKWFAEVRANFFKDGFIDSDFLMMAEASGLSNLTIGAESGVPHCLEEMAKGITVDDILNSAKMLSKTKISAAYSFIIGLPNETEQDILQTVNFVSGLKRIYPHAVFNIAILRAYPRTKFTEHFAEQGWIREPSSLAEFANHGHNRVYTGSFIKPVWHSNPSFAHSVARVSEVAFGSFNRASVREHLKGASVLLLPEMTLQRIAFWRVRHRFFRFLVDVSAYRLLHWLYFNRWIRRLAKWAR